jgi:hypothetical protein
VISSTSELRPPSAVAPKPRTSARVPTGTAASAAAGAGRGARAQVSHSSHWVERATPGPRRPAPTARAAAPDVSSTGAKRDSPSSRHTARSFSALRGVHCGWIAGATQRSASKSLSTRLPAAVLLLAAVRKYLGMGRGGVKWGGVGCGYHAGLARLWGRQRGRDTLLRWHRAPPARPPGPAPADRHVWVGHRGGRLVQAVRGGEDHVGRDEGAAAVVEVVHGVAHAAEPLREGWGEGKARGGGVTRLRTRLGWVGCAGGPGSSRARARPQRRPPLPTPPAACLEAVGRAHAADDAEVQLGSRCRSHSGRRHAAGGLWPRRAAGRGLLPRPCRRRGPPRAAGAAAAAAAAPAAAQAGRQAATVGGSQQRATEPRLRLGLRPASQHAKRPLKRRPPACARGGGSGAVIAGSSSGLHSGWAGHEQRGGRGEHQPRRQQQEEGRRQRHAARRVRAHGACVLRWAVGQEAASTRASGLNGCERLRQRMCATGRRAGIKCGGARGVWARPQGWPGAPPKERWRRVGGVPPGCGGARVAFSVPAPFQRSRAPDIPARARPLAPHARARPPRPRPPPRSRPRDRRGALWRGSRAGRGAGRPGGRARGRAARAEPAAGGRPLAPAARRDRVQRRQRRSACCASCGHRLPPPHAGRRWSPKRWSHALGPRGEMARGPGRFGGREPPGPRPRPPPFDRRKHETVFSAASPAPGRRRRPPGAPACARPPPRAPGRLRLACRPPRMRHSIDTFSGGAGSVDMRFVLVVLCRLCSGQGMFLAGGLDITTRQRRRRHSPPALWPRARERGAAQGRLLNTRTHARFKTSVVHSGMNSARRAQPERGRAARSQKGGAPRALGKAAHVASCNCSTSSRMLWNATRPTPMSGP